MSTLIPDGVETPAHCRAMGWGLLGAAAAALPALWMWGFTVDDALISVRYARHVAGGIGWRFNVHGPSTDGVTPLPWLLVLAPFARADALTVLSRAKALGLCVWIATGAAVGHAVGGRDAPLWARLATLAVLACSIPLAAYAVSGMETALATSIATFAVLARRPRTAALLAGLAASLRPEMVVWAVALGGGLAFVDAAGDGGPVDQNLRRRILAATPCALISLAPFVGCALVRLWAWGRPAPLAVLAKPGDAAYGLTYVTAGYFVTIVPLLVAAPFALLRSPRAMAIVFAAAAHACCIAAIGGDWMPYARLLVPVLPSLAIAASMLSERAHPLASAARSLAALTLGAALIAGGGSRGRLVGRDRRALVVAARPVLAGVERVAALDVGWVGAATEADIVDLAGVTDPAIAVLPGGHTSKRVSATLLLERAPDLLLLYAPTGLPGGRTDAWREATFRGVVESRLARDDVAARHFAATDWLPLGNGGSGYVVLSRRRQAE